MDIIKNKAATIILCAAIILPLMLLGAGFGLNIAKGEHYNITVVPDPLILYTGETTTIQTYVHHTDFNPPTVYFTIKVNGEVIGEGYGTAQANIVQFSTQLPNSYNAGSYTITSTAQIVGEYNETITATGDLTVNPIVVDSNLDVKHQMTINVLGNNDVQGATVTIIDINDQQVYSGTTTSNLYTTTLLESGTYKVSATKTGYITQTKTVTVNGPTNTVFQLTATTTQTDSPTNTYTPITTPNSEVAWYQPLLDIFEWFKNLLH